MRRATRCAMVACMFSWIACVACAQDDVNAGLPNKKKENKKQVADSLPQPVKDDAKSEAAKKHAAGALPDDLTLADALAQALQKSPQILVAEAKVNQAQADLNLVRHSIVHDVTAAWQRWSLKKGLVNAVPDALSAPERFATEIEIREQEAALLYMLGSGRDGGWQSAAALRDERDSNAAEDRSPREQMMRTMREQSRMQGQMMGGGPAPSAMLGGAAKRGAERPIGLAVKAASQPQRALPDNLRKFLAQQVDLDFADQPLQDVCQYLQTRFGGVNFVWNMPSANPAVTCELKNVTVESALQAISDLTATCFVLRDYGILVVSEESVHNYAGSPIISSSRGLSSPSHAQ